jgi:hypothetical protein
MAEPKTKPTTASVPKYLDSIEDETRRKDAKALAKLFREVTGLKPRLWGETMVGYGSYDYTYESGHSGTYFLTGFAPRKANLVLYLLDGFDGYDELLARLGPHRSGRSCLYLKRLDQVDTDALRELLQASFDHMVATHGERAHLR